MSTAAAMVCVSAARRFPVGCGPNPSKDAVKSKEEGEEEEEAGQECTTAAAAKEKSARVYAVRTFPVGCGCNPAATPSNRKTRRRKQKRNAQLQRRRRRDRFKPFQLDVGPRNVRVSRNPNQGGLGDSASLANV